MSELATCGHRMRNAKQACGKPAGHKGPHMTAASYEYRRAQGREYDREYRRTRPESQRKAWRSERPEYKRERKFGLDPRKFAQMVLDQDGRCAICGVELSDLPSRRVHVDHDHAHCPGQKSCGGCVRGILCGTCNAWLGHRQAGRTRQSKATPVLVKSMERYIADPPAMRRRTA